MAATGFIQATNDIDLYLVAIENKGLVPEKFIKYNNPVFGYAGALFGWGSNGSGQLGLSDTSTRSRPVQTGADVTWKLVMSGDYMSAAIKGNGTLWSWGSATLGQLGQNNGNTYSSPIQVGTDTNWATLASRTYRVGLAVKTDGTMWSWGYNNYGQLGLNNTTDRSSPVQVGGFNFWSSTYASQYTSHAITTSGALYSWGYAGGGALGLNDAFPNRSVPVQVGTNTNWKQLAPGGDGQVIAVKTDGTLWAWGFNNYGQLGFNDRLSTRSSPVQVGTNTNWSSVAVGRNHSLALKTDGTLWVMGRNNYGQLGQSNVTNYSSPIQVGSGTNWSKIFQCSDHNVAIKTDGTMWAWGRNGQGQLGLGSTSTAEYSPVQVGTNTNWLTAGIGNGTTGGNTMAIATYY